MSERFNSTTNLTNPQMDTVSVSEEATSQKNVVTDDTTKLRMLGYDAVLGRPLGFWSTSAMSFCHMCFLYEYMVGTGMYGYSGPLLFIIGYPFLCILHLILLGPFAELASAFPVAGAMATWSWRCARAGARNERQWGYLASGVVLAGHLGKVIAYLYNVTNGLKQLYLLVTHVQMDLATMKPVNPQAWWNPVFHVVLVSITAILLLSRVARHSLFWIACGFFNIFAFVFALVLLVMCQPKTRNLPMDLGFPTRSSWTHSFAYMVFTGLPLKVYAIDSPAHMAEETDNPQKTIPRAMYASTLLSFVVTYTLIMLHIFVVSPFSKNQFITAPLLPLSIILDLNEPTQITISLIIVILVLTQLIAAVVVASRFIFALARDCAIPFSSLLVRTSKNREPWVADLLVIGAMYASIIGQWIPASAYYNLIQAFGFWFMALAYAIPLGLYITSKLDLQFADRTQFSLRSWSKPCAGIALAWLVLELIQGCFPISDWSSKADASIKVDQISALPFVIIGIVAIIFVSWWLYGRSHYIGPIRALTKWSAGVEINPMDFNTAAGRKNAIAEYIQQTLPNKHKEGRPSWSWRSRRSARSGSGGSVSSSGHTEPKTPITPTAKNTFGGPGTPGKPHFGSRLFGSKKSGETEDDAPSTIPQSGLFPLGIDAKQAKSMGPALAESGLFPAQTQAPTQTGSMTMDPALVESQVLPQRESRILLPTPIMTRGKYIGVIDESDEDELRREDDEEMDDDGQSIAMRDLSPRSRSKAFAAAHMGAQLEPYASTGSFGTITRVPPASQSESHLNPNAARESFAPAQMESQLEPEPEPKSDSEDDNRRESFTETENSALPESQLDPTTGDSDYAYMFGSPTSPRSGNSPYGSQRSQGPVVPRRR